MRAHLDPNKKAEKAQQNSLGPKEDSELTGAAAVHKMAQLESNFLAQSLTAASGMQNIFGAKAAAAAAAFAGLTSQQTERSRMEDNKSNQILIKKARFTNFEFLKGFREEIPSSRSSSVGPQAPQTSSSSNSGSGGGRIPGLERSTSGDSDNEISKNRDFYRSHDVRPPFTYAALIRQVNKID